MGSPVFRATCFPVYMGAGKKQHDLVSNRYLAHKEDLRLAMNRGEILDQQNQEFSARKTWF